MIYQPTEAQKRIMEVMTCHPETCKTIASRLTISRQNVSQQCRIMADNDLIKQHGRGKFSLKPEHEATLKEFLRSDPDYHEPRPEPKKLKKKEREVTSFDTFSEQYPGHFMWLMNAATKGNSFAISLLAQLKKGWALTAKQMAAIEQNNYAGWELSCFLDKQTPGTNTRYCTCSSEIGEIKLRIHKGWRREQGRSSP